jgi:hypothetical protein
MNWRSSLSAVWLWNRFPPSPVADEMVRAADEALSAARRAGKNRVGMFEDMGTGRNGSVVEEG